MYGVLDCNVNQTRILIISVLFGYSLTARPQACSPDYVQWKEGRVVQAPRSGSMFKLQGRALLNFVFGTLNLYPSPSSEAFSNNLREV